MTESEAFSRHVARFPDMLNVVVAILWYRFQTQGNVVYRHGAGRSSVFVVAL